MGILKRDILNSPEYRQLWTECGDLRRKLKIAEAEGGAAKAQLEGRKDLMWWIQSKADRQRKALDELNHSVTSLRFAVKVMEHLHGPLTRDEWVAARDAVSNEAHRDRIDADPVSV